MTDLRATLDWIAADRKREHAIRDCLLAGRPVWTVNHGLQDDLVEQAIAMLDQRAASQEPLPGEQQELF
jgi:hypothetical protein